MVILPTVETGMDTNKPEMVNYSVLRSGSKLRNDELNKKTKLRSTIYGNAHSCKITTERVRVVSRMKDRPPSWPLHY